MTYVLLVVLGGILWQQILIQFRGNKESISQKRKRYGVLLEVTVVKALPLGALTVFVFTLLGSFLKTILFPGGLSSGQAKLLLFFTAVLIASPLLLLLWRKERYLKWGSATDVIPLVVSLLVIVIGIASSILNRTTALAIFMGGGDHANHVGRSVSILNAGAAGSIERLAVLRPGGLNPLHYLVAELFASSGGTPSFDMAADMYLFFYRFEWIQLGIWVLVSCLVAQVAFVSLRPLPEMKPERITWALVGCSALASALLFTPFVGSVGFLGFSTSLTTAWLALVPAVAMGFGFFYRARSLAILLVIALLVLITVLSIRPADAAQTIIFPLLVTGALMIQRKTLRLKGIRAVLVILGIVLVLALITRVLGPYAIAFVSAGNPSGTSEELPLWLLLAFLTFVAISFAFRSNQISALWFWIWLWASIFGLLSTLAYLVLRFGSPPSDPDYLVSKGLFATAALVIPVVAGFLIRFFVPLLSRAKLPVYGVSMLALPLAVIPFLGIDKAWQQVFDAWAGRGHPMTWYAAPFARGLDENVYPFSLKNRDAAWLAALSREAYSLPILTYQETTRPDPVYGGWYEMYLCKFIEENEIKVFVTDGFELQGALTDCPAAVGLSYVVPPRATK